MKLLSFHADGENRWGATDGAGAIDLGARLSQYSDLLSLLRAGALAEAEKSARGAPADYALEDIAFLPPVPNPEKTVCIGVNYANRDDEYVDSRSCGRRNPNSSTMRAKSPSSSASRAGAFRRTGPKSTSPA